MLTCLWFMVASSSLFLAIAARAPWPFAITPLIAALALAWSGVDDRRGLGLWTTAGLLLTAVVLAVMEYRAAAVPDTIQLAGALAYTCWAACLRRGSHGKAWLLVVLSFFHVAAIALTDDSVWLLAALPVCVYCLLWTLSTMDRESAGGVDGRDSPGRSPVPGRSIVSRVELPGDDERRRSSPAWLAVATVACLAIGAVTFAAVPRLVRAPQIVQMLGGGRPVFERRVVGYSDHVRLGEPGEVKRSDQEALRVRFTDEVTGQPVDVVEFFAGLGHPRPYFRGAVAHEYSNGNWLTDPDRSRGGRLNKGWVLAKPVREPAGRRILRQEWELARFGSGTLFVAPGTFNCRCLEPESAGLHHPDDNMWSALDSRRRRGHWREVRSRRVVYVTRGVVDPTPLRNRPTEEDVALPRNGLPRLVELADDLRERALATRDGGSLVRRIVDVTARHLRLGPFLYRLETVPVPPGVDPVEDFLFDQRVGFCEHFATAMTLLLRANGVPARIVTGYAGGERDEETGDHVLRGSDAHSWVEAYVDGRWQLLDPTPHFDDDEDERTSWGTARSTIDRLWYGNVVGFDGNEQLSFARGSSVRVRELWTSTVGSVRSIGPAVAGTLARPSLPVSMRVLLGAYATVALVWLLRRRTTKHDAPILDRATGLFSRLEDWAAGHGVVRKPSQTPREFAKHLRFRLASALERVGAVDLPSRLVDVLYRARFGHRVLEVEEAVSFESELARLEAPK